MNYTANIEKLKHSFKYFVSEDLLPGLNSLWESVGKKEILSLKRDESYLNWRYKKHPEIKYKFHYLLEGENILSFVVTRDSSDAISFVEVMSKFKKIDLAIILKQEILNHYTSSQIHTFKFVGKDPFYYDQVFEDFARKGDFKNFVFSLANDPEDIKIYENRENWTLSLSNQDMI